MIERLYEIFENSSGVSIDTRQIKEGSVYFALKGENFNGNLFAEEALTRGSICAIVDEDVSDNVKVIKVDNVLKTLQELAIYHRNQLSIPVVGLTGSNGKTTTKELIREVLDSEKDVLATDGNLNNHIGVPLTLLSIRDRHEIAVIEMGANHPGEIAELCSIALPDYGIITNIGKAHLEGFGGYEGVKKTKAELYHSVKARGGKVLINRDDAVLKELLGDYTNVVTYGESPGDVTGHFLASDPFVRFEWQHGTYQSRPLQTHLIGKYNFHNILAAITVGLEFGINPEKISEAICRYTPQNNRSQVIQGKNTLILDAYNANPTSMKAAVENFADMPGPKYVVIGDMFELGEESLREHGVIIELLENLGLKGVLIGRNFSEHANRIPFKTYETAEEGREYLSSLNLQGYTILLKGSRGVKLETLKDLFV